MAATRRPLVLMYHGVQDVPAHQDEDNMFVTPENFEAQLRLLLSRGYQPLTEREYLTALARGTSTRRSMLVTFDDGYVSVLDHAAPVLRRLSVPAVCYVLPGNLGGLAQWAGTTAAHRIMDADQVLELSTYGVSIGSHGMDHHALPSLPVADQKRQVSQSREAIGDLTGQLPATYAYPYGLHCAHGRHAAQEAGYELAFATYDGQGRWATPRVDVNATDTLRTLALKATCAYPRARAALSAVPQVRRLAHQVLGAAGRS